MASLATCSISGLPINEGDKIKFIPLKKNKYMQHKNYGTITPSLIYMNDMFNPLTLPITGIYQEYDNISDIFKDKNVLNIESYYGLSIYNFVKIINCSRTFNDNYSELLIHFGKNKELRDETYQQLNFERKLRVDVQNDKKNQVYTHPHEKLKDVEFVYDEKDYTVFVYKSNTLIYQQRNQLTINSLLDIIYKLFNIELNVIDEKESILEELKGLTGMFVLDEVYQELISNFKSDIESTLISFEPEFNAQMSIYKKDLDELNGLKKCKDEISSANKDFQALINKAEKELFFRKRSFAHSCMYLDAFKHWEKFGDIYFESVVNGSLKKTLDEFWFFRQGMYLVNKQFMPNVASYRESENNLMILNTITRNILERRISEYEIFEIF